MKKSQSIQFVENQLNYDLLEYEEIFYIKLILAVSFRYLRKMS